jgi:hypothetical protein
MTFANIGDENLSALKKCPVARSVKDIGGNEEV